MSGPIIPPDCVERQTKESRQGQAPPKLMFRHFRPGPISSYVLTPKQLAGSGRNPGRYQLYRSLKNVLDC